MFLQGKSPSNFQKSKFCGICRFLRTAKVPPLQLQASSLWFVLITNPQWSFERWCSQTMCRSLFFFYLSTNHDSNILAHNDALLTPLVGIDLNWLECKWEGGGHSPCTPLTTDPRVGPHTLVRPLLDRNFSHTSPVCRWHHFCHVLTFRIKKHALSLTPPLSMTRLPCQRQEGGGYCDKNHWLA